VRLSSFFTVNFAILAPEKVPNKVPNKLAGFGWIIADKSGCEDKFSPFKTMTYLFLSDFCGQSWSLNYPYGVQGVASSNPAAPTIRIKHLDQSLDWSFCFLEPDCEKVPNKVPNK
jgi:hypothetical protein